MVIGNLMGWSGTSTPHILHSPVIRLGKLRGLAMPLTVGCEMVILKISLMIISAISSMKPLMMQYNNCALSNGIPNTCELRGCWQTEK